MPKHIATFQGHYILLLFKYLLLQFVIGSLLLSHNPCLYVTVNKFLLYNFIKNKKVLYEVKGTTLCGSTVCSGKSNVV